MGYKLHCTKKLLDRIKPPASIEEPIQLKRYENLVNQTKVLAEAEWQEDNAAAIQSSNAYVDKHGLPFKLYRVK